jgi:methylmalonyl-CoA mutase N-terminal domain/subunit
MRERYGARDERSWKLRFHTQTAGVSLTAQQPEVNIARTAIEALSAVLGGTQSLHTNAMDEVLALPTDKAARIALRTQQVLAYESGVANTVDPLGGSYFVEDLTRRLEEEAESYFEQIEAGGGVVAAIEAGFMQKEIADAAFRHQQELEARRRIVVGVNEFTGGNEVEDIQILRISPQVEEEQLQRVREVRRGRDGARAERALATIRRAAPDPNENLMPHILEAVRAYCTEGEIMGAMVDVFGRYTERAVI